MKKGLLVIGAGVILGGIALAVGKKFFDESDKVIEELNNQQEEIKSGVIEVVEPVIVEEEK